MYNRIYFSLLTIIIFLLIILVPNFCNAEYVSASDILKKDLTKETMATLKEWNNQMQNGGGQNSKAVAKIRNEVERRLATDSISIKEIYTGIEIWGDTDTLQPSTLQKLESKLKSQNVPGNPTGQKAYSKIKSSLGERTSSGTVDPLTDPDWYAPTEQDSKSLTLIAKPILAIINIAGVVVSVVALAIIGLRYMFGSIQERAQYKETMVPYIIGLVMLGGITTIVNIIYNIATNFAV